MKVEKFITILQTYVQDKLLEEALMVYNMLTSQNGHLYVCGDYIMAENVTSTLKVVFQQAGGLSLSDSETLLAKLKACISKGINSYI